MPLIDMLTVSLTFFPSELSIKWYSYNNVHMYYVTIYDITHNLYSLMGYSQSRNFVELAIS